MFNRLFFNNTLNADNRVFTQNNSVYVTENCKHSFRNSVYGFHSLSIYKKTNNEKFTIRTCYGPKPEIKTQTYSPMILYPRSRLALKKYANTLYKFNNDEY